MKSVKVGKRSRSLGVALTPKGGRILERRPTPPGQHGKSRRGNKSDYGKQLLEKQRLKAQYNVSEIQLRNYFKKASRSKKSTGTVLLQLLESRLDCVVLRAGFAPTIYAARQLVSHGHILVNGKRVNIPSFNVEAETIISPAPRKAAHPLMVSNFAGAVRPVNMGVLDQKELSVQIQRLPERQEIAVVCDEQQVVEFYSR